MAFLDKTIRNLGGLLPSYHEKSETLLGLLFNEDSIQIAEVKASGSGRILNQVVFWRVDNSSLDSKTVTDNITFYSKQIQQALNDAKIESARVAIVVPIQFVNLHTITTPQFDEIELETLAQDPLFFSEFLDYEDEVLNEKTISYQILRQDENRGETTILIGVIDKKLLEKYLEIARFAGLTPVIVDVDFLAAANTCWMHDSKSSCLGNWNGYLYYDGSKKSYLMLSDGYDIRLKEFNITDADLILMNQLAEMKEEYSGGQFWEELADRISIQFIPFIEEVEKEFVIEIEKLFYYVKGEDSIALDKLFKDKINEIELVPLDAFNAIEVPDISKKYVDAVDNKSFFAPLMGASSRRLGAFVQSNAENLLYKINFSPAQHMLEQSSRFAPLNKILTFIALGIFSIFTLWFAISDLPKYYFQQDQLAEYETLQTKLNMESPLLISFQGATNKLEKQLGSLNEIKVKVPNYMNSIILIGESKPNSTTFSSIHFEDKKFVISGQEKSIANLVHYLGKLESSKLIRTAKLTSFSNPDFNLEVELWK